MAMMDPNPKSYPVLSYVMARLPSMGPRFGSASPDKDRSPKSPSSKADPSSPLQGIEIVSQMPNLSHPAVLSSMTTAITDVAQTRAVLRTLGPRPDHETVDQARAKLVEIEASLSDNFEELDLTPGSSDVVETEHQRREENRKVMERYKAILQLDELHEAYEKLLKDAEGKLVEIYEKAEKDKAEGSSDNDSAPPPENEANEEVIGILQKASGSPLEVVDLSGRMLRILPEAFGKIQGLVVLNLSNNQLQAIPDSIAGLQALEILNASSNLLESLPDSIGLLVNLKILKVSENKLTALPDSIAQCRSLVEVDVSFNRLTYLPTNIGIELVNLQKLDVHLNKIRSLPTSVGEMVALRFLDAHFNQLGGLPLSIGKLTNLEVLNLSSNFSDLEELPDTIGDLVNLRELDLSNNQIHVLPGMFGQLYNLTKLNLEHNPLVIPPMDVVKQGVEAVKIYMIKRWDELLSEEEKKYLAQKNEEEQTGWLARSTSWLKTQASNVSDYIGAANSPKHPYLDQEL